CNEQNEKGEPVTWQGRQYQPYPIQGSGFELNGKGTSTRPTLTVSNLYGMVTGDGGRSAESGRRNGGPA
ncbi:minor tail protein, partial [Escherichia coli O157:H- str. 493-89]